LGEGAFSGTGAAEDELFHVKGGLCFFVASTRRGRRGLIIVDFGELPKRTGVDGSERVCGGATFIRTNKNDSRLPVGTRRFRIKFQLDKTLIGKTLR
ncbi:MAG: hypothetical protein WBQ37_17030, partial [Candidatus Competibacter sp.]